MIEDTISLIQTLGFPIAAYLLLYFDLRNVILTRLDRVEDDIRELREEIK